MVTKKHADIVKIYLELRYILTISFRMKHNHKGRRAENFDRNETNGPKGHRGGRGEGRPFAGERKGRRRMFDGGELRILLLSLIQQQPRHGYELIKAVSDQFGGAYEPSPGVIYPTLSWLDDIGYAVVQTDGGSRKKYAITPEGDAFLVANAKAAEELRTRKVSPKSNAPDEIVNAMHTLRETLKSKHRADGIDPETVTKIVAVLSQAQQDILAI